MWTQLPFFSELRVFDPRQRDTMPSDISACSHVLPSDDLESLHESGQWALYFKQEGPPQDDHFDLLKWWLNASVFATVGRACH